MLFLILTHSGLYPNNEVERLHAEAGRLYSTEIPDSRILVVDSLLKLIHCDLEKGISIEEIRKSDNKKKILSSYREQAEDEKKNLIDVVYESSRFEKMFSVIDEFSMKAPCLQLCEILDKIKNGYEEQEKIYIEKINVLEKKKKNPQEFEHEINRISGALDKYRNLIHQTKQEIEESYTGRHSIWQKDIDSLKVKYPELITNSNTIENVRKNFHDAFNAVNEKVHEFSRDLTIKLENALEGASKSFLKDNQITLPLVDLNSIEEKAKRNAYRNEDIYEDRPFDMWDYIGIGIPRLFRENKIKKGSRKVFDEIKYIGEYKSQCNENFYKMVNFIPT